MNKLNSYAKFVVSLLGLVWSAYQAYQPSGPHAKWSVAVAALISSLLVWFVPNQAKTPAEAPPPPDGGMPKAGALGTPVVLKAAVKASPSDINQAAASSVTTQGGNVW